MASTAYDAPQVFHASGLPVEGAGRQDTSIVITQKFVEFLRNFRLDNDFIYRDQLKRNLLVKNFYLEVDLGHLGSVDEDLGSRVREEPSKNLPMFETAVKTFADDNRLVGDMESMPELQVMLLSNANPIPLRELDSVYISKLVRIHGIIIASSTLTAKATHLHIMCKSCRHTKVLPVGAGYSSTQLPRQCDSQPNEGERKECPLDPWVIVHDKCKFIDQQTIKLQETLDGIPVGELPRHMKLTADRGLVNRVIPGTRVTITGILDTFSSTKDMKQAGAVALRSSYIRIVGMEVDTDGNSRTGRTFTEEEEETYLRMGQDPNIYEKFSTSIAPSIYGSEDMKRAIVCLLIGGSKKILPDGMKLRGDINVLMLGDPGTAKSQLLKFVEKVAPIAVYTSGKGSSAAGLTASVVRDPATREFYLEGGAMVLADGGVVCIDEFDKMREEDRVAIHEAMEQQTISIAKAGITTILNSRTSVLAAANPVFGRYNDLKSPGENIDFQSTILSRFDMIFIVRDEHNEARDQSIARHVIGVHMSNSTDVAVGEYDIQRMRGYISFCKQRCAPRLSAEASEKLTSHFVGIRSDVQRMRMRKDPRQQMAKSSIPITIRQLEAIVRISESLAKIRLANVATSEDVEEAIRLFKFSTLNAVQSGMGDMSEEVEKIQEVIRRRLPLGWTTSELSLKEDLRKQDYADASVEAAIHFLVQKNVLLYKERRKILTRLNL